MKEPLTHLGVAALGAQSKRSPARRVGTFQQRRCERQQPGRDGELAARTRLQQRVAAEGICLIRPLPKRMQSLRDR